MITKPIYNPKEIEPKWQRYWVEKKTYQPDLINAKRPFYNLMMFPYPSAEGLHVGNVYAFTGADVYGRFQRMQGYDVFEPIGLDGFGIHSENYAIKVGRHPAKHAKVSEKHFYEQLHQIGNGFAWDHKLETYDPAYYRWTQWLFIQMYKHGLAYRKAAQVNWCPSCKTVLSDEQVEGGICERCKTPTTRKETEQWFFRITKYVNRLLENLQKINWPKKITVAQQNWIGKSNGVELNFEAIDKSGNKVGKINVFTTAHDTIFGATFMVLSPEHKILDKLISEEQKKEVNQYISQSLKKTEQQRREEEKQKTGVFTGGYVLHPFTGSKIPVWVADYVLMEYGTGAVMGVPGHDARDHEFAKKYKLSIEPVIKPKITVPDVDVEDDGFWNYADIKIKYLEESELFNSDFLNGLTSRQAKKKVETIISEKGIGKVVSKYHLRDWLISRQRYWGPPIPMIYCAECAQKARSVGRVARSSSSHEPRATSQSMAGWFPVPEEDLPVLLPYVKDFQPIGEGKTPLEKAPKEWREVKCPNCGKMAERSVEVSDTFLDSSWYFLAYPNLKTDEWKSKKQVSRLAGQQVRKSDNLSAFQPFNLPLTSHWLPVTAYIGGAEHAVLHLLYARFVWMCLKDWGYLPGVESDEPFPFLFSHGLIIKDGAKMSKSRGNVVNPDDYITRYGADTLRMYLMFVGPYDKGGDFRDSGMAGMYKFLERVWKKFQTSDSRRQTSEKELQRQLNKTIKRVAEDYSKFKFNTIIARLMEFMNAWSCGAGSGSAREGQSSLSRDDAMAFLRLLAPVAPHMSEELYHALEPNAKDSIHRTPWPTVDESLLAETTIEIPVQINGKTRAVLTVPVSMAHNEQNVSELAKQNAKIMTYLEKKEIMKQIFIPKKTINFVVAK